METKEETVFFGHPVLVSRLGLLAVLALVAVAGIYFGAKGQPWMFLLTALAVLLAVFWWLLLKSVVFKVTNQRVLMEEGILGRKAFEVDIRDIRSMEVERGLLGMMFNFGDLLISTAGQSGIEITFHDVQAPMAVKEKIHALKTAAEASSE